MSRPEKSTAGDTSSALYFSALYLKLRNIKTDSNSVHLAAKCTGAKCFSFRFLHPGYMRIVN